MMKFIKTQIVYFDLVFSFKVSKKDFVKLFRKVIHKDYKEIEVNNADIPLLKYFDHN